MAVNDDRGDVIMARIRALPTEKVEKNPRGVWYRSDNTWSKVPVLAQCVTEPARANVDMPWVVKWLEPGPDGEIWKVRTFGRSRADAELFYEAILGLK